MPEVDDLVQPPLRETDHLIASSRASSVASFSSDAERRNHALPRRGILKNEIAKGYAASDPETLQSQIRSQAQNRLSIKAFTVVHRRQFSKKSAGMKTPADLLSKGAALLKRCLSDQRYHIVLQAPEAAAHADRADYFAVDHQRIAAA